MNKATNDVDLRFAFVVHFLFLLSFFPLFATCVCVFFFLFSRFLQSLSTVVVVVAVTLIVVVGVAAWCCNRPLKIAIFELELKSLQVIDRLKCHSICNIVIYGTFN